MSEGDSNGPPLLHCNQDCSAKQKTYRTAVRLRGDDGESILRHLLKLPLQKP
jgi:hypothetical protein